MASQKGVGAVSAAKTALTVAALGATAYSRVLGKKMERADHIPVEGTTEPNPPRPRTWRPPSGSSALPNGRSPS